MLDYWLENMSDLYYRLICQELRDLELRVLWVMEHGIGRNEWKRRRVLRRLREMLSNDPREKVLLQIRKDIMWLMDEVNEFEDEEER